ncbi:hypothetical protein ABE01_03415 [Bacillus paralicheniformis]|nr:hypothetical protein ACJ43_11510 [Bacillus paralicheniformis]KRT90909.1 hypothetical protein ACH97_216670 [Bacillus paralicheniformis]MBG9881422.1 hypothetical protein [Bacillus paralicheniformis]
MFSPSRLLTKSFQRDPQPLQSRKAEHWGGANVAIREHRRAGLTTNARVCRHAERDCLSAPLFTVH